jgi:hypothetical protein
MHGVLPCRIRVVGHPHLEQVVTPDLATIATGLCRCGRHLCRGPEALAGRSCRAAAGGESHSRELAPTGRLVPAALVATAFRHSCDGQHIRFQAAYLSYQSSSHQWRTRHVGPVLAPFFEAQSIPRPPRGAGMKNRTRAAYRAVSPVPMLRGVEKLGFRARSCYDLRISKEASQSTLSKSPGFQVLSNQGCSGPYSRKSVFHPLPGIV